MKKYINELISFLKENPITFDTETGTPCLEDLWWHYAGFYPIQNDRTKREQSQLSSMLKVLDSTTEEAVLALVNSLCGEYEKLAFIAGMKLGIQLMTESIVDQ